MNQKSTNVMSIIWMTIFSIIFLILVGRFLFIQITGEVQGVDLQKLADEKRTNQYTINADRGTIYDRNNIPLVQDHVVYRIYAILDENHTTNPLQPKHVKNIDDVATKLAPVLEVEASEIKEVLKNGKETDKFQVEFGKYGNELSQQKKDEIEALDIPGIYFSEEPIRFYPNGMFASHTLGLTKKENEEIIGISGVESFYDDVLTGKDGYISYQRDKFNYKLLNPKEVITEADNGDHVVLTLDQKIQTLLEDSLTEVMKEYEPERISAVVVHAKTGEVLAMSNRPSFNPNNLGNVENWYNDVISTPFEPGSTMKIFTLAAAIEEGVWNPDETLQSGTYKAGTNITAINDWRRNWGTITYLEGIQRSSNVAAAKLAYEKLGPEKFLSYLKAFDFDKKTGIDLSNEVIGKIQYNYPIEQITTAFGQGTTTTPMQLVKAATAITNNGKMLKPYIIKEIIDADTGETLTKSEPEVVGEPISSETAQETLKVLETVITSKVGTGYNRYKLDGYSLAGKTGTAQIPNSETNKGYLTGRNNYVFSFLGMAPANDPELIMYVSVKQPNLKDDEPDSAPVSFIFNNVMENSMRYLNIDTDQEKLEPVKLATIPEWRNATVDEYKALLEEVGIQPIIIGNGKNIVRVNVDANAKVTANEKIIVLTDQPTMPNVKGWALRDVITLQEMIGIEVKWSGEGYVKKQDIKEGTELKSGDILTIELASPTS